MKKLLEKDGFYLALFVCVSLVSVGGVWFTKNNVEELASNELLLEKPETQQASEDEKEVHLIQNDIEVNQKEEDNKSNEEVLQTSTESKENLETAKKEAVNKLNFLGSEIIRHYSEKEPSYSKTLDVWEIHKGIDVSANVGQEVKSLLDGKVVDVFKDEEHGMTVKVESAEKVVVMYSNLDEKVNVKKGDSIKEGQTLGVVGKTSFVEVNDGPHVHVEAFKEEKSIDPMTIIK